jgi:hypothetical protein
MQTPINSLQKAAIAARLGFDVDMAKGSSGEDLPGMERRSRIGRLVSSKVTGSASLTSPLTIGD